MRVSPEKKFIQIKRSFFMKAEQDMRPLDDCIQGMKGVYASMRLVENSSQQGLGLAVNVDVANGTFWTPMPLHQLARNVSQCRGNPNRIYLTMREVLKPAAGKAGGEEKWVQSQAFKELRKLVGIKFTVPHRGKDNNDKVYTLKKIAWAPNDGEGGHAKNTTFAQTSQGKKTGDITVYDYFRQRYNITLQHWYLPLVQTVKDGLFPMELCKVLDCQRYMFKTNPVQVCILKESFVTLLILNRLRR